MVYNALVADSHSLDEVAAAANADSLLQPLAVAWQEAGEAGAAAPVWMAAADLVVAAVVPVAARVAARVLLVVVARG